MLYRYQFKNLKEELYTVEIQTGTATNLYPGTDIVALGEPPCVIASDSDSLYAPIKSRSCTINLVLRDYVFDLYSQTPRHTKVTVKDKNNTVIFFGYLTPCIYSQQYSYLDTVQIEAVDAVSSLKDFSFDRSNQSLNLNLKDICCALLYSCGYTGYLYVPDTYDRLDGSSISDILASLYISGGNFFGDDDEKLPLTNYEVLTEILRFMGWSLCPDGLDCWLIDYRAESQGSVTYKPYAMSTGTAGTSVSKNDTITISKQNGNIAGGTPSLSMDNIYNNITVSANLFEINELAPDLNEDSIHESVTEAIQLNTGTSALNVTQWTKQRRKSFLGWSWNSGDPVPASGVDYQTFCTLNPASGWTHKFWHMYNLTPSFNPNINDEGTTWYGCNWYDTTNTSSNFQGTPINKYMNTVGCLLQHHAVIPDTDNENLLPTSVDWDDLLTFFILNDTAVNNSTNPEQMTAAQVRAYEVPVLEYHIPDIINYKPRSGTNWICISGDIWYQCGGTYKDKDNKTWELSMFGGTGSNQYFVTCPIDKPDVEGDLYYDEWNAKRTSSNASYGDGWPMWKMQLKIGNRYWNGSAWTTTASTFSIPYNNAPDDDEDEALVGFDWMKTCSNTTYKDKVGQDGYCIPIADTESGSFIGDFTLTIYCPSILPQGVNYGNAAAFTWKHLPNVIYVKDFSLDYIYTDSQVWYKQHARSYKDDYIYTGYINQSITNKFSGLKLKMNTALAESPISRSFVCSSNGYISTMRHKTYSSGTGQVQEKNLLDMYLDHYKEPKPIYEIDLHGMCKPWYKYSTQFFNYTFLLDSYSYDLKYDKNRVKLIAF